MCGENTGAAGRVVGAHGGSVRVRHKKSIFKVSLKFLHISCHVNCFIKMAFF